MGCEEKILIKEQKKKNKGGIGGVGSRNQSKEGQIQYDEDYFKVTKRDWLEFISSQYMNHNHTMKGKTKLKQNTNMAITEETALAYWNLFTTLGTLALKF